MELNNGKVNKNGFMGSWSSHSSWKCNDIFYFICRCFQSLTKDVAFSYGIIFTIEGILFLASAALATKLIIIPAKTDN